MRSPDWSTPDGSVKLYCGDCLEVLPTLEAGSVDAVVTDPPYGLSFMGKDWDHGIPGIPFWETALDVLKPSGYALIFGGTRTYHRLAMSERRQGRNAGGRVASALVGLGRERANMEAVRLRNKAEITKYEPWPTMEAEWAEAKSGDAWPAFRHRVANQFYRLLWHEGGRWYFMTTDCKVGTLEDCAQVASLTLLRAIDAFDPTRGAKFITYLVKGIRRDLSRASDEGGTVRVPFNLAAAMRRGERSQLDGYAERASSILPLTDWAKKVIPDRDHIVFQREEWELTKKALTFLDARAKEVITRRYLKGEMLREVGEAMGVTKERVRQIEKKALRKLRRLLSNCFESSE